LAVSGELRDVPVQSWMAPLRPIVTRTLLEPLEERALDDEIPAIGATTDAVSRAVKAQYEENPYPRGVAPASREREDLGAILAGQFPHFEPPSFLAEPLRILVAGCGTGYHPISIALRYDNAEILATDVSRASLCYGLRMARQLGIDNLTFVENDLLNVSELGGDFDVIECVGVLHHLHKPSHGLALLLERLRPGGLVKLGLYSAAARRPVMEARERIEALGLRPVAGDILAFRQSILEAPPEETLRQLLDYSDFYTLSSCRDLLFHVQEHCFDPMAIGDLLLANDLRLVGFEFADRSVPDEYQQRFPDDVGATDLSHWSAFEREQPGLFAGLYQFWCQRRE
jgi:SAM-dependent methyltransferase